MNNSYIKDKRYVNCAEQYIIWEYTKKVLELSFKEIPEKLELTYTKISSSKFRISSVKENFFFIADLTFNYFTNELNVSINVNDYIDKVINDREIIIENISNITSTFILKEELLQNYIIMENEEYIDKENDHLLNSYNRVINGCKKYHKKSSFIFSSVKDLVEIKEDLVRVRR